MALWVCYHDNSKLRASLYQTGSVGEDSDRLQVIKFWPSRAPGKGVYGGAKIFGSALAYYSQRAVFASLRVLFFVIIIVIIDTNKERTRYDEVYLCALKS